MTTPENELRRGSDRVVFASIALGNDPRIIVTPVTLCLFEAAA